MTAAVRTRPPLGGLSLTLLRLELRRLLRNRRTVIFTLVMPAVFFLLFGTNAQSRTDRVGGGNVTGYVMLSLALYGAILATTSVGAAVSIERAAGWSRHLRLTPLTPAAYIVLKLTIAMVAGAAAVVVVLVVGRLEHAELPAHVWIASGLLAWACALVFAALGLFMGYLLPSENVMQVLGPVLAVLSFGGGLFVPLDQLGGTFRNVAHFLPTYGVGVITRYPLTHEGSLLLGVLNAVAWTLLFGCGALWRFRRDTARV
jgi:ABC-2 type transport system permease protein